MNDKDKPMGAADAIHIIDDGDWWYWLQDDIEYDASEKMHAAFDLAIVALREKTARESAECEYCQGDPCRLDWQYGLDHISPEYQFCLMCGRRLAKDGN